MQAAGVEILLDVSRLSAIGPVAALRQAGNYVRWFRRVLVEAERRRPKLAVLVDFPDFNLPLARRLKRKGIPVCWFIAPQVWAWRESRVKQIRRNVDLMLVILPFEEGFFRCRGVEAVYVGNPSAARFSGPVRKHGKSAGGRPVLLLMPGSRSKEVELILPLQLETAALVRQRRDVEVWVLKAPEIPRNRLQERIRHWARAGGRELPEVVIREEPAEEVLPSADVAVVKSGTATLETMLAGVPFAMVYRIARLSWYVLRPWVRTRTYCLANWVAGKQVVPEFVQDEAEPARIAGYILDLLNDPLRLEDARRRLLAAAAVLGSQDAYTTAAEHIRCRFLGESEGAR